MSDLYSDKIGKIITIDLLSNLNATHKWRPGFLRRQDRWTALSNKWEFDAFNKIIRLSEPQLKPTENISIIGPSTWNDLTFHVNFKIVSDSIRPPEGGAILYFMFKNLNNFYSFHFCLCTQKIEFVKRYRGAWSITAGQDFDLVIQKDYSISISTNSGNHRCRIDGQDIIEVLDGNIPDGCVGIGAKYCGVEFTHVSVFTPSVSILVKNN